MIRTRQYRSWSAVFHEDHAARPISIQMELTYRCPLHCIHCYSDCYNNPGSEDKELSADGVKDMMDKLYDAGCLWLCLTGGDPLVRSDFPDIYEYARRKGFVVTVFTSLASLDDVVLKKFIDIPPFVIEVTVNGATPETYERVSQVKGSFSRVMANMKKITDARLPLRIKAMVLRENMHEMDILSDLGRSFGCDVMSSAIISARLDGDSAPCKHRVEIDDLVRSGPAAGAYCGAGYLDKADPGTRDREKNTLFSCPAGKWQWNIDPVGRLSLCAHLREPSYDLSKGDLKDGMRALYGYVKTGGFSKPSECERCEIRRLCYSCPGRAKLETGDEGTPVPYFCELARREAERS
ncbi:MAG: radical SAM protein [Candidatus Omnitrophota bacterium]